MKPSPVPFVLSILLLMVWAAVGAADNSASKPAWKWTLEERLAARLDPAAIKARHIKEAAYQKAMAEHWKKLGIAKEDAAEEDASDNSSNAVTSTINGSESPELFLPSELFEHLLEGFSSDEVDRVEIRRLYGDRATALGFGSDLWSRLEKVVSPYLELRNERERKALAARARNSSRHGDSRDDDSAMDADDLLFCRSRAEALSAAKAEFGEESFLRLLYEAVAPSLSRTFFVNATLAEQQRFLEGGCTTGSSITAENCSVLRPSCAPASRRRSDTALSVSWTIRNPEATLTAGSMPPTYISRISVSGWTRIGMASASQENYAPWKMPESWLSPTITDRFISPIRSAIFFAMPQRYRCERHQEP
jgi:hypothetical protein